MNTLLIRNDEFALVEIDLDRSIFKLTWRSNVPGEMLRRILIQAHMQVVQHRVRHWLSDSRAMGAVRPEDEAWVQRIWIPRIFNTGLQRLAIVPSQDRSYQAPANRLIEANRSATPFPVDLFQSPEEAEEWLLKASVAVA